MTAGSLASLRVLEYADGAGAAYAAKLVADLGGTVTKVEPPRRGSALRRRGPGFIRGVGRGLFQALCANKESVTLDLGSATGRRLFLELAGQADAVIVDEALACDSGGALDLEQLRGVVPVVSVTSMGADSPLASSDIVAFNVGGLGYLTPPGSGRPEMPPLRSGGGPQSELQSGINAAVALLAILRTAPPGGRGALVDVSGQEAAILCQEGSVPQYTYTGTVASRIRETALWSQFMTVDGLFYIHKFDEKWADIRAMVDEFSTAPLAPDDLLASPSMPTDREALRRRLGEWFSTQSGQSAYHYLQARGVACAPATGIPEGFHSEHLRAREFWEHVPLNGVPAMLPKPAIRLSGTPSRTPVPAARLGRDTVSVLASRLGCSSEDIDRLQATGIA